MAFTPETFVICSKFPLFKANCNLWIYCTEDTLEECLADHYFQPRLNLKNQDSPEVGDIIQCIVKGSNLVYLKVVSKTEKPYNIGVEQILLDEVADLEEKIDLAANSGSQLYETGVWYAKMHAETVAPSAEDGTNYADFSQTDGQGNPIIVIYERQSGAWVEIDTITPPDEYNGYITVTSKIWDIVEQSGQQGGQILWSFNQKTFTPYPKIVSFESVNLTGDSTVDMPVDPTVDSIVNKGYVDTGLSAKADSATTLAGYGITDGVVKGHEVIAFQAPTAQNNYAWYRKYADGWVEQGGQTNDSTDGAITITLPVQLADANYVPQITGTYITDTGIASNQGASKAAGCFSNRTTTGFTLWKQSAVPYGWEIKWMAQA